MRKGLFTLIVLFAAFSAIGQSKFQFGLRLSPVISWANTKDSTNVPYELPESIKSGSSMGLSYGLAVNYYFADNFGIYTGLNWVTKGYNLSGPLYAPLTTETYKQKRRLSALEIPLALRLRSKPIGPESLGMRVRGLVGVSGDINVSGRVTDSPASPQGVKYSTKWYQPAGVSTLFGLGVEWNIEKVGTFDLGVSYHKGLLNQRLMKAADGSGNIVNPSKFKQRFDYISLDVAYLF
ncbi:MAG: PorT family protein [Bacteroidia bacterium]|nr:PorT family protein [Bacteroidia bacterium]